MVVTEEKSLSIINWRKVKQDFASQALRDGRTLFAKGGVIKAAKVVQFTPKVLKVQAQVVGAFSNAYTCELEIDRFESEIIDSSCDCPNTGDCQHIACLIFYLEAELEKMLIGYSQDARKRNVVVDDVVKHIEKKVEIQEKKQLEKSYIDEYVASATLLGTSPFFVPKEELNKDIGEISILFSPLNISTNRFADVSIVLKLPFRSKPFYISQPKQFFLSLTTQEPMMLGGRKCVFGIDSFGSFFEELIKIMRVHLYFTESKTEKGIVKAAELDREGFGELIATAYEYADKFREVRENQQSGFFGLPGLYWQTQEKQLLFSETRGEFSFAIDYLTEPRSQLVLTPSLNLGMKKHVPVKYTTIFECSRPGAVLDGVYFRLNDAIKREHIHDLENIQKMSIPEPLFGAFIETSLPILHSFAEVRHEEVLSDITTYPAKEELTASCDLIYANGELEAKLEFHYDNVTIEEAQQSTNINLIKLFVTKDGILARNLVEENSIIRSLFQGFIKDERTGAYVAKNDRKIVEFMTEIIPKMQHKVKFSCPENLQNQFTYDDTKCVLSLTEGASFDKLKLTLKVDGSLKGVSTDYLWDCVATKRTYIVLTKKGGKVASDTENELEKAVKILVLKLKTLEPTLHIFDELGIKKLEDLSVDVPLWMLVNILEERFVGSTIQLKLSPKVKEMQRSIFDENLTEEVDLPESIRADFRNYQKTGIQWLRRLRKMGLNGILADDMGLGKTLQAITAITQYHEDKSAKDPEITLIITPTSLVDNWKEEFRHFNAPVRVATVTGTPQERKKILSNKGKYDVLVTSYGLVQKDIEIYESMSFGYVILDEAQAIKNRETRNARSVKKIPAKHKLILTGTPLENSLEDLWSLFDFLMPGILGSFDRFINSYVKAQRTPQQNMLVQLKKKVTPFVLRRMKVDVLNDLPPISHLVYNCRLSPVQQELYTSFARSAREQLTKLVEKEGFDRVRLQVLATLTRLKQICCHPAIFAKENVEEGDSAKYEMLLDLLSGLVESKHKTVIFSQYTQMLAIMRQDLIKMGIKFAYLDGTSKNRLSIVKQFNEDPETMVFLVSLKVGGTGLNLVGADTVIHYDMWWNPAVENQATDRVWRMGQTQAVSSYKLVTLDTIEEKIVALQERKKNLLKEIVRGDDEIISKLTWNEVLDLLKT